MMTDDINTANLTGRQPGLKPGGIRLGRKILILVVEKDPFLADLERYFLEQQGFSVEFCGDGLQALKRTQEIHPDLVIAEILLPGLDGLTFCRRIKSDPEIAATIVLIFSAIMARERSMEAGADAFLLKPFEGERLLDTIKTLLKLT